MPLSLQCGLNYCPNSMEVCDLGGGSGSPRLHTGSANILWVKKNHDTRGERLQIATYNVRTLLKG